MSKVRLGMVGGGAGAFIGQIHRMAAAMDGEIELVCGAFHSRADKSRDFGRSLGLDAGRAYQNYQQMFAGERALAADRRMELVAIVAPNALHFPVAAAALDSGFAVFCEKPATLTRGECTELRHKVAASGQLFGLAHTYAGYPLVQEARRRVSEGDIGQVQKVVVEYSQDWLAACHFDPANKQAAWRLDPAQAGASCCLGDIGVHAAHLAEFIGGQPIAEVLADLASVVEGRALDDDASVLLRFANGARGVLIASQVSVGEENNLHIRVYGSRGSLAWRQQEPNSLWLARAGEPAQCLRAASGYLRGPGYARTPPGHPEGYIEAFANLYRDFAAQVRRQRSGAPQIAGICGIDAAERGMAFIDAALRSNAAGNRWTPLAD